MSTALDADQYPWNIRANVAGIGVTGSGYETRREAVVLMEKLAREENVTDVEVIQQ